MGERYEEPAMEMSMGAEYEEPAMEMILLEGGEFMTNFSTSFLIPGVCMGADMAPCETFKDII